MKRLLLAAVVATMAVVPAALAQEPAPDAGWTITPVRGAVYRVQAGAQTTVFLATTQGIVVVDPLNPEVARWLREQFASRFPGVPLRDVIYTHYDFRRASGAAVLRAGADIIAHDEFTAERRSRAGRLPPDAAALDLSMYDRNGDGVATPAEVDSYILSPTSTYRDRRTIALGDERIELVHVPGSSAGDLTVVVFAAERLLFADGALSIHSLPRSIGSRPAHLVDAARLVEQLEFDTLLTGDGEEGTRADVTVSKEYLQALIAGVRHGVVANDGPDAIAGSLTLDRFATLPGYAERRESNIREVYATLVPVVTTVHAALRVDLLKVASGTCERYYATCDSETNWAFLGGTAGVTVAVGRLTIAGDVAADRLITRRVRASDPFFDPYEQVLEHREVAASALVGYNVAPRGRTTVILEAGPSFIVSRNGWTFFSPFDTYFEPSRQVSVGLTIGTRIARPVSRRLTLVIPAGITFADRGMTDLPRANVTAAVGLQIGVARHVW